MIGVDVGGTFTDISLLNIDKGELSILKVKSTVKDPSRGIVSGIKDILDDKKIPHKEIGYLAHGTTVATNALIERKGAKTGLITTEGFEDLFEIGDQTRPDLYDYFKEKPEIFIPSGFNYGVEERLYSNGKVHKKLNKKQVKKVILELKEKGVESIAVCTLFSFVNPKHEKEIVEIIKDIFSEVYVSASHKILPEFREYPRLSTTALNAYLGPVMEEYVNNFRNSVKDMGIKVEPYVNQSNGSIISISETIDSPIKTAVSGPSAGVVAAEYISDLKDVDNIITFDMGGTSADVSLVENNEPVVSTERKINGFPVKVPMIDINTVGAGGGSIAWIDDGGALKVGPQSSGAEPGPACYQRGGMKPTVTDANVALGRLNPNYLLGGKMEIDYKLAVESINNDITKNSNMNVTEAASGIIDVVNSNMIRAIRVVSVEQGYDPREFSLVSFGGAGSLHACSIANELNINKIIIPYSPGIFSSIGLLVADIKYDFVNSKLMIANKDNIKDINKIFDKLVKQGNNKLSKEKIENDKREFILKIDARYLRQNYELQINLPKFPINKKILTEIKDKFHKEHENKYGYSDQEQPIEFINFRANAIGKTPTPTLIKKEIKENIGEPKPIEHRKVYYKKFGEYVKTPIYNRKDLNPGQKLIGPAIIEQMDTTILVKDSWNAKIDEYLNLTLVNRGG